MQCHQQKVKYLQSIDHEFSLLNLTISCPDKENCILHIDVDVLKYGELLNRHKPTEVIRKYRVAEHVTTTMFNRTNVQHNVSENGHKMKYQNGQNSFFFFSFLN